MPEGFLCRASQVIRSAVAPKGMLPKVAHKGICGM